MAEMVKRYILKPTGSITLLEPLTGQPFKLGGKVLEPFSFREFMYRLLMASLFAENIDSIRSAQAIYTALNDPAEIMVLEESDWVRLTQSTKMMGAVIPYTAPVLWQLLPFSDAVLKAETRAPNIER